MNGWLRGVGAAALLLVGCGGDDSPAAVAKDSGGGDTGSGLEAAPPDSATLDDGLVLDSSTPTDSAADSAAPDGATDADAAETTDVGPYVAPGTDEVLCKKDTTSRLRWDGTGCWDDGMPAYAAGTYHKSFRCTFQKRPDPTTGKPACWPVLEATIGGWASTCDAGEAYLRLPSASTYDSTVDEVITVTWERMGKVMPLELNAPASCSLGWSTDDGLCTKKSPGTYPSCWKSNLISAKTISDRSKVLGVVTP